ncbi:MAG: tetratricopeptide repeat protein [Nitrospiraceae bacterium]|nr:tetratricopeptide repeat protein [Nitrospiraceae bacterium]MDA8325580.1 tetratricopeptide repeat protein [Nitrospiraceae bacterium]
MDSVLKELYAQGSALFEEGKYDEAEPYFKDIIKARPDYADVLNKLGLISYLRGDLKEAALYFERAVKKNPEYTEASLNLVIASNDLEEFEKAEEVITKAANAVYSSEAAKAPAGVPLDPYVAGRLANEHLRLGNAYMEHGLAGEAIEEYRKAVRLRETSPDARTRLGMALREKGMFDEAIAELTRAKEHNPGYGPAWIQLGLTYYMRGMRGLAFREWEGASQRMPDLKEARFYLKLLKDQP